MKKLNDSHKEKTINKDGNGTDVIGSEKCRPFIMHYTQNGFSRCVTQLTCFLSLSIY